MANILVIEDDPGVRRVLLSTLQYAGHVVHAVDNGRDGLRAVCERAPDLVVTDIVMPEPDGLQIIEALKRDHPHVRIIAISGGGMICRTAYLELAHLLGAHKTLQKPVLPSDLLYAVSELLEGPQAESGTDTAQAEQPR
jgi:CheY-like chemotaxis protein